MGIQEWQEAKAQFRDITRSCGHFFEGSTRGANVISLLQEITKIAGS
jgi:hypothetical protein